MEQPDYKAWIQNIVSSVDILEASYKHRLANMAQEYQQDVEDILNCYKQEKQRLIKELNDIKQQLHQTNSELQDTQRLFKVETVGHKITKDCLLTARYELTILNKAIKIEKEPVSINSVKKEALEKAELSFISKVSDELPFISNELPFTIDDKTV